MADGRLYACNSPELFAERERRRDVLDAYSHALPFSGSEERSALLAKLVAEMGEGCVIEPPFCANWGGANLHLGNNVYANMGLTLVDDADIFIEDDVMIGPNVTISCTAAHPISPRLRAKGLQYNKPVRVRSGAWLGAGCVVLPGVTVGRALWSARAAWSRGARPRRGWWRATRVACCAGLARRTELVYDHDKPVEGFWRDA